MMHAPGGAQRRFSHTAEHLQGSAIRKMGVMAVRVPDMISFAPGYPDPAVIAWNEFREIASDLLSGSDASVLQYGPTRGLKSLIDVALEILESRGIKSNGEEVLITTGSQQGIDLVGRCMLDPGDVESALKAASAIGDDTLQRQSQGHKKE